jgi:hypothetical protein
VFALACHVFNELMLLMKWIHISRRPPGNPGPQEDAAIGITMLLVRLLSSKVYEALHEDALRKKSVADVLRADYFGKVDGLNEKWDAVLARHDQLEWLGWIRNRGGFHYMNANQWAPGLEDPMCEGAYAESAHQMTAAEDCVRKLAGIRVLRQGSSACAVHQVALAMRAGTVCLARGQRIYRGPSVV